MSEDISEELLSDCMKCFHEEKRVSASLIQRRFRLGYVRALDVVDVLIKRGMIIRSQSVGYSLLEIVETPTPPPSLPPEFRAGLDAAMTHAKAVLAAVEAHRKAGKV